MYLPITSVGVSAASMADQKIASLTPAAQSEFPRHPTLACVS